MTDKEDLVSSTALFPEGHHYEPEPDPNPEPGQDHFSVDDIVDLVGGAQDALERHIQEATVTSTEPEHEPAVPDYTGFSFVPEEESEEVVAPRAEPESTRILPEPQPEPAPESDALPAAAEPQKTAPSSAEAEQQPPPAAPASCKYPTWGGLLSVYDYKSVLTFYKPKWCSDWNQLCSLPIDR